MKIYTKTGDRGDTALFGGARVSKASARVQAYGNVDELNSVLGEARSRCDDPSAGERLQRLQSELFCVGAELASAPDKDVDVGVPLVSEENIRHLESIIDALEPKLPALKSFILPGGAPEAAALHLARTVCRRAERDIVALAGEQAVRPQLVRYLNRLGDLLFVLARDANRRAGVEDVPWLGRRAGEA